MHGGHFSYEIHPIAMHFKKRNAFVEPIFVFYLLSLQMRRFLNHIQRVSDISASNRSNKIRV